MNEEVEYFLGTPSVAHGKHPQERVRVEVFRRFLIVRGFVIRDYLLDFSQFCSRNLELEILILIQLSIKFIKY